MAKIKYTDRQIKKLLTDIHEGIITDMNLPEDLYFAIGAYLQKGVLAGIGEITEELAELASDLTKNTWLFSAAKTYQFTNSCQGLLVNEEGVIRPFNEFYKLGVQEYNLYNKDWAKSEYNTTIANSQMAEQWQGIEKNQDILPYLTFSTDGKPCPECAPFEGLTAPVNSPIWNKCMPTLHFNCLCLIIPSDDAKLSSKKFIDELPIDTIPKIFQNNPGKTGEIFTKDHPYFSEAPKDLRENNFNLPLPKK